MCWPRFLLLGSWEKRRQSDLVSFLLSVEARQARVRAKIIFRRRYRSSRALALSLSSNTLNPSSQFIARDLIASRKRDKRTIWITLISYGGI